MSSFNNLKSGTEQVLADEVSFFWKSFKSGVAGVSIPTTADGYDKGGEYNTECGITVIRATVRDTAGKLVEAYKRADADDKAYLTEAGFKLNSALQAPAVPAPGCNKK